jgi:hypothetical protein
VIAEPVAAAPFEGSPKGRRRSVPAAVVWRRKHAERGERDLAGVRDADRDRHPDLQPRWNLPVGEEPRGIALVDSNRRAIVSLLNKGDIVEIDLSEAAPKFF